MSDGSSTPPGWYPDQNGQQRWWDGSRWSEPPQAQQAPQGPQAPQPPETPPTSAYGQSYGAIPPQPAKKKTGLYAVLAVGAVALIAGIVALVLVLTGNHSDSSASGDPTGDPVDTVQAFFDAAKDGDCDEAVKYVTDAFLEAQGDCDPAEFDPGDVANTSFDVGDAEIDGDAATVPVTITEAATDDTTEDVSTDLSVQLVRQDGEWLIDDFSEDSATDAPSADTPTPDSPSIPSDLPTDFPTDFLTDLPTDFPTDFLTDFPTDFPTDFLTDFPTDFPTDVPTN